MLRVCTCPSIPGRAVDEGHLEPGLPRERPIVVFPPLGVCRGDFLWVGGYRRWSRADQIPDGRDVRARHDDHAVAVAHDEVARLDDDASAGDGHVDLTWAPLGRRVHRAAPAEHREPDLLEVLDV